MESVVKPDRPPDHVTSYGSVFWWHEMIYMPATGGILAVGIEEDTGKLHVLGPDGIKLRLLAPNIKELYDYWLFGAMEEAMLKVGKDEDSDV